MFPAFSFMHPQSKEKAMNTYLVAWAGDQPGAPAP